MKDNTYITIQSWMRTKLNLSGNELLVYAVIYGFSQDGESRFNGSRQYLADWCGCSVRSVQTILNDLTERGLLTKYESFVNNVKHCEYVANFTTGENISPAPSENSALNNIATNKTRKLINTISKDIVLDDVESKLYTDKPKSKKSLYEKCIDTINEFTDLPDLKSVLVDYLKFRLSIKDKPLYNVNQWKSMLKKLDQSVSECMCEYIDVVQQSIDKSWLNFYPIQKYNKKHDIEVISSEFGEVNCDKVEEEELADESF